MSATCHSPPLWKSPESKQEEGFISLLWAYFHSAVAFTNLRWKGPWPERRKEPKTCYTHQLQRSLLHRLCKLSPCTSAAHMTLTAGFLYNEQLLMYICKSEQGENFCFLFQEMVHLVIFFSVIWHFYPYSQLHKPLMSLILDFHLGSGLKLYILI